MARLNDNVIPPALDSFLSLTLSPLASAYDLDKTSAEVRGLLGDALLVLHTHLAGTPFPVCSTWTAITVSSQSKAISNTAVGGDGRLLVRIAFTSDLVAIAAERHLAIYSTLFSTAFNGNTPSSPLSPGRAAWVKQVEKERKNGIVLRLKTDSLRYISVRLTGFKLGPDHANPSSDLDFLQPYGSKKQFDLFLSLHAPNCHFGPYDASPRGDLSLVAVLQREHVSELYRLNHAISPEHNITTPLNLKYELQHRPTTQCCSICGEVKHTARQCSKKITYTSSSSSAMVDTYTGPVVGPRGVCRYCYSPDHAECHTAQQTQQCKVCHAHGHTSFFCKQYKPHWRKIAPPSSAPRSQLAAFSLAQQRGQTFVPSSLPPLTYADAAGRRQQQPPPSALLPSLRGPASSATDSPLASTASQASSSSSSPSSSSSLDRMEKMVTDLISCVNLLLLRAASPPAVATPPPPPAPAEPSAALMAKVEALSAQVGQLTASLNQANATIQRLTSEAAAATHPLHKPAPFHLPMPLTFPSTATPQSTPTQHSPATPAQSHSHLTTLPTSPSVIYNDHVTATNSPIMIFAQPPPPAPSPSSSPSDGQAALPPYQPPHGWVPAHSPHPTTASAHGHMMQ